MDNQVAEEYIASTLEQIRLAIVGKLAELTHAQWNVTLTRENLNFFYECSFPKPFIMRRSSSGDLSRTLQDPRLVVWFISEIAHACRYALRHAEE